MNVPSPSVVTAEKTGFAGNPTAAVAGVSPLVL